MQRKIPGTLKSTQGDLERHHEIGFQDQSRVRRNTRRPQQDHRRQADGICGCQPSTRRHISSSSIESDGSAFSSLDRRATSSRTSCGTEIGCGELAMSSHSSVTTRSLSETGSARREEISMLMDGTSGIWRTRQNGAKKRMVQSNPASTNGGTRIGCRSELSYSAILSHFDLVHAGPGEIAEVSRRADQVVCCDTRDIERRWNKCSL